MAVHPDEGRVHQSGRLRQQPSEGVRRVSGDRGIGITSQHRSGAFIGAGAVEIDDRQPLDPGRNERMTDRRARAARAQQNDGAEIGPGQSGPKRGAETTDIGVVTDQPAVSDQHRVDGADRGRAGRDVIEVGQHLLLARMRHIARVEAEIASLVEQDTDVRPGPTDGRQIDRTVEIPQTLVIGLPLVHRRRQGRDDALPDESDQERLPDGAHMILLEDLCRPL